MRKIVWLILFLVLAGGVWYAVTSHGNKDDNGAASAQPSKRGGYSKNAVIPVGVATAKTGDMPVYLDGLGNVTPRSTVIVHTQINGQLMQLLFNEGQMIEKDAMLAKIDDRPYVAQLEQVEGLLTRDQALLADAKVNLARYKDLWAKDSIAKQQLDSQAALVKQYEGAVRNDQGQVDNAKVNIAYTNITSPVAGRVGLRQVDLGNVVHTTDTNGIVVVTELQPITALFTLPEDSLSNVLKHTVAGDKLEAEAWDRDSKNKLAQGTLLAVDNQVDPSTGTVKLRAEFDNKDDALFPSQFVNIRLKVETQKSVVLIPTSGVQRGTKGTFVYLVKPDKTVAVQNITLGVTEGETVVATQGVGAGDQIVVDGADSLRDGAKVEVAAADGATKSHDDGGKDGKKSDDAQDKKDGDKSHHHHKKHADDAKEQ